MNNNNNHNIINTIILTSLIDKSGSKLAIDAALINFLSDLLSTPSDKGNMIGSYDDNDNDDNLKIICIFKEKIVGWKTIELSNGMYILA